METRFTHANANVIDGGPACGVVRVVSGQIVARLKDGGVRFLKRAAFYNDVCAAPVVGKVRMEAVPVEAAVPSPAQDVLAVREGWGYLNGGAKQQLLSAAGALRRGVERTVMQVGIETQVAESVLLMR